MNTVQAERRTNASGIYRKQSSPVLEKAEQHSKHCMLISKLSWLIPVFNNTGTNILLSCSYLMITRILFIK